MKNKLLLLAFSLIACVCSAQTAVQLLPSPKMQFMDSTGTVPLAMGKVCTYQAGTTTPLATYTDSTGTVANTNPVILDVAGRAQIWWGTAAYKVTLLTPGTDSTCATGSQVWSIDNVSQKYFRLDGSNVLTAISDPSVALGEFWLSSTNAGFLKWSDASAIHTVVGADSTQTLSNKTIAAPVITGTSTGTGIPTLTQKKGSGAGNYTGTNTAFGDVDATNLSYTVTIPTGWKLWCGATLSAFVSTSAAATLNFTLADGGVALPGAVDMTASAVSLPAPFALNAVITGDGASHTIRLQAATSNAADAWNIVNGSATRTPVMACNLSPSN